MGICKFRVLLTIAFIKTGAKNSIQYSITGNETKILKIFVLFYIMEML